MDAYLQMDKHDKKIEVILRYAQKAVIRPFNIYTIDNPDALFIASGNLFGLFIPTKGEIQHVDLLVRRIMVSRFAYANNMKALLLSEDEGFLHGNFPLLNRICHRILDNDANGYQLTFNRDKFESNTPDIGSKIRAKQANQYARNLKIYQLGQEENRNFATFPIDKRFADGAVAESWSQSQISVKDAYMLDDFFVAFKRKTMMSFKEAFNNLMTLSFFMNYSMHDEGISYRNTLNYPKMINSDFSFIREDDNDPYKYIRVLAFMGLSPIHTDSLDTCLGIRAKMEQKWQNRINPRRHY